LIERNYESGKRKAEIQPGSVKQWFLQLDSSFAVYLNNPSRGIIKIKPKAEELVRTELLPFPFSAFSFHR
jgi:hypothetical protein